MKDQLKTALKGMAMGTAEVIPGVSGGTIALITGASKIISIIIDIILLSVVFASDKEAYTE